MKRYNLERGRTVVGVLVLSFVGRQDWFLVFGCFFVYLFLFSIFRQGLTHCVVLDGLKLTRSSWLALNSQIPSCLCLPGVGIKGAHHHTQQKRGH